MNALTLSAIAPSLLILWYFHKRDVYPEPAKVVWTTFALGILTVIPVLIFVPPLRGFVDSLGTPLLSGLAKAFMMAAIPEEFFKFLVLFLYCAKHSEFDEPMDGIVYGVAASLGFATLENILYVTSNGFSVAVLRAVTAVPGHAFWGAIMGFYIGQAKFQNSNGNLIKAFMIPMMLHGIYDFPLMAVSMEGAGSIIQWSLILVPMALLGSWMIAIKMMKVLRSHQVETNQAMMQANNVVSLHQPRAQVGASAGGFQGGAQATMGGAAGGPPHGGVTQQGSSGWGWFGVLFGGGLCTVGAAVILGVMISFLSGDVRAEDIVSTLVGTVIIGVVPLLGGIPLFISGIGKLNTR